MALHSLVPGLGPLPPRPLTHLHHSERDSTSKGSLPVGLGNLILNLILFISLLQWMFLPSSPLHSQISYGGMWNDQCHNREEGGGVGWQRSLALQSLSTSSVLLAYLRQHHWHRKRGRWWRQAKSVAGIAETLLRAVQRLCFTLCLERIFGGIELSTGIL